MNTETEKALEAIETQLLAFESRVLAYEDKLEEAGEAPDGSSYSALFTEVVDVTDALKVLIDNLRYGQ